MRKTLLLTTVSICVSFMLNAQTVWNFGNDATNFPVFAGLANGTGNPATSPGGTETINGLTICAGLVSETSSSPCGVVAASSKTFTSPTTSTAYTFVNRFMLNGAGYTGAANTDASPLVFMPTLRYAKFNVSGNSTIYMIGVTGSNGSARNAFITDGTKLIGVVNFPSANTSLTEGTINYEGPATTLYLYFNASIALYYMSATNVIPTSVDKVFSDKGISYNGSQISNSNALKMSVYDITGKHILSANSNVSTANLAKGIYIVKAEGVEGALKIIK